MLWEHVHFVGHYRLMSPRAESSGSLEKCDEPSPQLVGISGEAFVKLTRFERWFVTRPQWGGVACRYLVPYVLGVAARVELPTEADVLELGAGPGFHTAELLRRFPKWRLHAIDSDKEMVDLARGRVEPYGSRVHLVQADATQLPYADQSFDLVISILVWHHVDGWRKSTVEVARVLRPGGRLIFFDLFAGLGPLGPSSSHTLDGLLRSLRASGLTGSSRCCGPRRPEAAALGSSWRGGIARPPSSDHVLNQSGPTPFGGQPAIVEFDKFRLLADRIDFDIASASAWMSGHSGLVPLAVHRGRLSPRRSTGQLGSTLLCWPETERRKAGRHSCTRGLEDRGSGGSWRDPGLGVGQGTCYRFWHPVPRQR